MLKSKVIAITGANGFIGSYLTEYLKDRGYSIKAITHHLPENRKKGITYFEWDLRDDIDSSVFNDVDVLVHCAYKRKVGCSDSEEVNRIGSKKLIESSKCSGVKQIIFLSSFSSDKSAKSSYGRQKFYIEKEILKCGGLVIQAGLVIGKGGLFQAILNQFKDKRIFPLINDGSQELQTISVDDLSCIIEKCIVEEMQGVILAAESKPVSYKEFLTAIANVKQTKIKFVHLPYWFLNAALYITELFGLSMPVTRDNLNGLAKIKYKDVKESLDRLRIEPEMYLESIKKYIKSE